jgi:uncharacterized protein
VSTARFRLGAGSDHGPRHWQSVRRNGLVLAQALGADAGVVEAFALLHDCRRENEWHDPQHGYRAAQLAGEINDRLLGFSPERLDLLKLACTHHDTGAVSDEPTLDSCWSADRADLGRVGVRPNRRYFSASSWVVVQDMLQGSGKARRG